MNKYLSILLICIGLVLCCTIYFNTLKNINHHTLLADIIHSDTPNDDDQHDKQTNLTNTKDKLTSTLYTFINPVLAYKTLRELNFNHVILPSITLKSSKHNKLKILKDDTYCDNSLNLFTDHPDILFIDNNYFTDFSKNTMTRSIIRTIGVDVPPKTYYFSPVKSQKSFHLSNRIIYFYTIDHLHEKLDIGKHFGCSHQLYNHMLDVSSLGNKVNLVQNYENYLNKFSNENKRHCIQQFIPELYLLDNQTQCLNFFNDLAINMNNDQKTEESKTIYMQASSKKYSKSKLVLLDNVRQDELIQKYGNGSLCGNITKSNILIERQISNPMLIHGHKFNLRVLMLIASVHPIIVYYNDGFLDILPLTINSLSNENNTITQQIQNFEAWNLNMLQDYLVEIGKIQDKNWIENSLRYQIKQAIIHIIRSTQHKFIKRSNIYHLWGLEFTLDSNLKIWLDEANPKPSLQTSTIERKLIVEKLLKDHFELMFAYLRSRIKRVIQYTNSLIKTIPQTNFRNEGVIVPNKEGEQDKSEILFWKINKNMMDDEFDPHQGSFLKIIDENLDGIERYNGLIDNQCLEYQN